MSPESPMAASSAGTGEPVLPAQVSQRCRELPAAGTAQCSCAATMGVPGSQLPAAAAGAAPSLQMFCSVAITPLRCAGARGLVGTVALQQVPHPGRVWQGGDRPPRDRVHPRLRPGSLPALSPPVVWGIADCAVVIKGLKQFSVPFDFTEQMLSPLFQHNVCRWQGFALPAAQRSWGPAWQPQIS